MPKRAQGRHVAAHARKESIKSPPQPRSTIRTCILPMSFLRLAISRNMVKHRAPPHQPLGSSKLQSQLQAGHTHAVGPQCLLLGGVPCILQLAGRGDRSFVLADAQDRIADPGMSVRRAFFSEAHVLLKMQ